MQQIFFSLDQPMKRSKDKKVDKKISIWYLVLADATIKTNSSTSKGISPHCDNASEIVSCRRVVLTFLCDWIYLRNGFGVFRSGFHIINCGINIFLSIPMRIPMRIPTWIDYLWIQNLFATSEPPKYSNSPNFFFKILFTYFLSSAWFFWCAF